MAELMENLWTGRNERGMLQFKSTYFTAEKVDSNPQRACDTVYHPRAVQPTLLYWQRTADERLTRLFSDWMRTWVDAAARAERGKPAGIIPSAIHWPNGQVGGAGKDWWDPRNHGEYTLYLWPSAMSMITDTLLLTLQRLPVRLQDSYIKLRFVAFLANSGPKASSAQPEAPAVSRLAAPKMQNASLRSANRMALPHKAQRFSEKLSVPADCCLPDNNFVWRLREGFCVQNPGISGGERHIVTTGF
jgi:hypothetical protein